MELTTEQKALESIVKKAWDDPVFKDNLIKSPVETIENFLDHPIHVPEGKKIAFVDQSNSSTIYFNIPAEPDMDDMELNEEQLDIISGGDGNTPPIIVTTSNYQAKIFSA